MILGFHCRGPGSTPGQGTEIQQAVWHCVAKKKKKERERDAHVSYWSLDGCGTVYDMGKTSQEGAEEEGQTLNQKAGGKSGEFGITDVKADTKTEVTEHAMG